MPAKVLSVWPEKVLLICDWVVSISGASAVTSTVVEASPTDMWMAPSPESRPGATTTPFDVAVLKPCAFTSTLYVPVGSRFRRKRPALSVVVGKTTPVSVFFAVTCAPDTTAPWGSTTDPDSEPFATCPTDGMHQTNARLTANR